MIRFGGIPTSPAIERWLTQLDAVDIVALDPEGRWRDPTGTITTRIQAAPEALLGEALARIHKRPSGDWTGKWVDADRQAAAVIAAGLQGPTVTEPGLAAALCAELPAGAALYVSNSMPVRDVDQFMATRQAALRVLSNRGASGIDGVTSSALGAAYELAPAVLLCGDLAFLHDASGLLVGGALGVDLTIVVPNNDGGGIFSLLPVVNTIPASDFERLFHTPHGVDLSAVAAAAGAAHLSVATLDEFSAALAASIAARGLSVIEARVDTDEGLRLRRTLEARVRESIDDPPG